MMALNAHPNDLTPGTLHYLVFLGEVKDEPFAAPAPRGWGRFERWDRIRLNDAGAWMFYARFTMDDGSQVMLSVDMITGKETTRNLWEELKNAE